ALSHQLYRLQPHQVQLPYSLLADTAGELAGIVAYATNELAAVATGCPPADAVCLQQGHLVARLCQVDGGIEAGKTATNDADIDIQLTAQFWPLLIVVAGGRIIGGHMFLISVELSCLHTQHPALMTMCLLK